MRRAGGRAARAADNAEEIIANLSRIDGRDVIEAGKLTRKGEARIKNCVKYDLGSGYRLVCLKDGRYFILLFAGTHDDCDRWINNNRERLPNISGRIDNIDVKESTSLPAMDMGGREDAPQRDYDEMIMEKITDRDLRIVFSGLCG